MKTEDTHVTSFNNDRLIPATGSVLFVCLGMEVNPRDGMIAIMDKGGHSPNSPMVFIIHIKDYYHIILS